MQYRYLKSKFQYVGPDEFEQFVADIWEQHGFDTEVTDSSKDRGVDVVARRERPHRRKEVIQAKRYGPNSTVGSEQVQRYAALQKQEDADAVIIVTSSTFTKQAQELAAQLDVRLIDGSDLCELVHSEPLYSELLEYIPITDTRGIGFETETVAERVVEETGITAVDVVSEALVSYFTDKVQEAAVSKQQTLAAFSDDSEKWGARHIVSLSADPALDSTDISEYILDQLRQSSSQTVAQEVLTTAIELILDQQIPTPLNQLPAQELAEWFIKEFDEEFVPLVAEDPEWGVDIAEEVIDTEQCVAVNKLRVAKELNLHFDEWL